MWQESTGAIKKIVCTVMDINKITYFFASMIMEIKNPCNHLTI